MFRRLYSSILIICLTLPSTLHSTDIYNTSGGSVQIRSNLNTTIIPGDRELGSTVLIVTTPKDMKDVHIESPCEHKENILYRYENSKKEDISIIQVTFPIACESGTLQVKNEESIFTDSTKNISITSHSLIKRELVNMSNEELVGIMRHTPEDIKKSTDDIREKIRSVARTYEKTFARERGDMAREILTDRENIQYISPVGGYSLPTNYVRMPGAGRGYRADTTDGIHHGWDIYAPYGTPVRALEKGIIIRVSDNWQWSTFNTLIRKNITANDRLTNLDIFRGNQIWLQTMDGNVTFYSHLSKISPNIRVGTEVTQGEYLGNIGTSGVPEKKYPDIHLHFEIQQNPYSPDQQNPSMLNIMQWDYIGKNASKAIISKKTREIFE